MKRHRLLALLPLAILLGACEEQASVELKVWMAQTRLKVQPPLQDLAIQKDFQAFRYEADGRLDPYDPKKLAAGLAAMQGANGGPWPDLARDREPLEAFPIDTLKMVGSMRRTGRVVGLIEVEKIIYQVSPGNYLGQDLGKVVAISDSTMDIDEMVQETSGNWITRRTQLTLQEKRK
jgi:type IV pilus assembly protein PilP